MPPREYLLESARERPEEASAVVKLDQSGPRTTHRRVHF